MLTSLALALSTSTPDCPDIDEGGGEHPALGWPQGLTHVTEGFLWHQN